MNIPVPQQSLAVAYLTNRVWDFQKKQIVEVPVEIRGTLSEIGRRLIEAGYLDQSLI
jgi:hypothetical protein